MDVKKSKGAQVYLMCVAIFYLCFGLITLFYPKMMEMFQTDAGKSAGSAFANNVWMHEGLDILSVALLLFVLSRNGATPAILRATAIVALMPFIAIIYSYFETPFWNVLFLGPAVFCLIFSGWGFMLASQKN